MCDRCEAMSPEDREQMQREMADLLRLLGVANGPSVEESLENMGLMLGGIIWQLGKEFTVLRTSIEEFAASGLVVDGNETDDGNFKWEIVPQDDGPLADWEKELLADGE